MSVAVGLDVGTTGLKALAVSEDGEVVGARRGRVRALDAEAGLGGAGPRGLVARGAEALEQLGADASPGIGLSGQMHGLVALDARRAGAAPGDPLERPAHGRASATRSRSGSGSSALIAATGNRALTGFTAPKLLWLEKHEPEVHERIAHILLPKDYVRLKLCGERAIDVADASGTLLFDVARRTLERGGVLGARRAGGVAAARARVGRGVGRDVATGSRSRPARATRRRARSASASTHAGEPLSVVLGTSGVVFSALPEFAADPRGARARVLPRGAGDVARDGRDAQRRGRAARGCATRWAAGDYGALVSEAAELGAGRRGPDVPALPGRRAHPARRPRRARRVRRAVAAPRPRRARARGARGRRLRPARLARPDRRARRRCPTAGACRAAAARSELWLQIVASVLELPLERTAVDEGAAFGAALLGGVAGGLWGSPAEAVEATVRPTGTVEPVAEWVEAYAEGRERFRALYPALRGV